jgi:hypothetical protein
LSENKRSDERVPGASTLGEILSQPSCWADCLTQLPGVISTQTILETFAGASEWLFVGCGSSYYVALAAAAAWSAITGLRARAVPAGIPDRGAIQAVQPGTYGELQPKKAAVLSRSILGGLHHEYGWEKTAA